MAIQQLLSLGPERGLLLLSTRSIYRSDDADCEAPVQVWSLPDSFKAKLLQPAALHGDLVAVCDDQKQLYLVDQAKGELVSSIKVEKAPSCLLFEGAASILLADRHGDVTRYPLNAEGKLDPSAVKVILGHVSIITDLDVISQCDYHLILTADRDEKIRVTRGDEPHIIEAFLLGHRQYVAAAKALKGGSRVVSVSGDGSLRLWDAVVDGEPLLTEAIPVAGRRVQVERLLAAADDEGQEEVEVVEEEHIEPLTMVTDSDHAYIAFDRSPKVLRAAFEADKFLGWTEASLPDGQAVISLVLHGDRFLVLGYDESHSKSTLFSFSTGDMHLLSTAPISDNDGQLLLEQVWKGGLRKDCVGFIAKRLLKQKRRAEGQEVSDVDDD